MKRQWSIPSCGVVEPPHPPVRHQERGEATLGGEAFPYRRLLLRVGRVEESRTLVLQRLSSAIGQRRVRTDGDKETLGRRRDLLEVFGNGHRDHLVARRAAGEKRAMITRPSIAARPKRDSEQDGTGQESRTTEHVG